MRIDPTPTYEQCTALADQIRSGDVRTAEERECLAKLLAMCCEVQSPLP